MRPAAVLLETVGLILRLRRYSWTTGSTDCQGDSVACDNFLGLLNQIRKSWKWSKWVLLMAHQVWLHLGPARLCSKFFRIILFFIPKSCPIIPFHKFSYYSLIIPIRNKWNSDDCSLSYCYTELLNYRGFTILLATLSVKTLKKSL